ncbi:MAG: FAD-dependent oxidoreductase [Dehalococcoidales bacterium]|nr:FAD-dependent oxidoreductase [Dehalococcoidales bacterium]
MSTSSSPRTITEPSRETNVYHEADVVVVGGGPGGHSAAVAAARNGARTILIERYGHLGGMASGGLVILIPHMSDGSKEQQIAGLCQEWQDRLGKIPGGYVGPKREEIGSTDPAVLDRWKNHFSTVVDGKIRQTWTVDPEMLKCIMNDMAEEAGVKLSLHSWGTQAIVDKGAVKGVIFESKSGRQAVLGKIIIDGTGDGDLLPSAGAEFDGAIDPKLRSSMLALVFRMGNCDFRKFNEFREKDPKKAQELMGELGKAAGTFFLPIAGHRNDVVWVNNWIPGLSSTNVEDLTTLEVSVRKMMRIGHDFMRKNFPGFENSFILDTASQTGTRGSRRLVGEYVVTGDDMNSSKKFDDTIAVIPKIGPGGGDTCSYIPYRALVPVRVEGLLVAGRSFSSDKIANDSMNLIPHCCAMGEASGTAAALAVKQGISLRKLDYRILQKTLVKQGAVLPGIDVK